MKLGRSILLLLSVVCLAIGNLWKSEKTFQMEMQGTLYNLPYQTIFLALAVAFALIFFITGIRKMFRKK